MYTFTPNTTADADKVNSNFNDLADGTGIEDKAIKSRHFDDQEDWHEVGTTGEPAFEDSWVNYSVTYNSCGFMKDTMGFVHLKGLVKSGTYGISGVIFTLPTGYRPLRYWIIANTNNGSADEMRIASDGRVIPYGATSNGWVSLDGITFRAEQ